MSHIKATESGPPETASTSADACFQSANRLCACRTEIGDLSSSDMTSPADEGLVPTFPKSVRYPGNRLSRDWPGPLLTRLRLALYPLLLTVDGLLDVTGGTRVFPRHFAECGAGGLLLLQCGQRLAKPQQGIRGFRRSIEFGRHRQKGFSRVPVLL